MLVVLNSLFRFSEITFSVLNFVKEVFILLFSNHRRKWATEVSRISFPYNNYTTVICIYAVCSLLCVVLLRYYVYLYHCC
jgi:hypothetical protein